MTPETSIYLHIPFCTHRCAYCDFNTYAGQEDSIPAYVNALIHEIDFIGRQISSDPTLQPFNVPTIFFGGGTPSLLSGPQIRSVMDALRGAFAFDSDLEASLEANPGTTSPQKLEQYRAAGINRLSFGVQSANAEELHMLERAHDFFDVIQSVKWARQSGFDNLNLDLIYGLPEQTLETWHSTVKRVLDLGPEHISAYALTLEHGTPFGRWNAKGLLPICDPDRAADMYEWASDYFESRGYVQYEISNWAKPGLECRHNLQYWRGRSYLGLGAGAHGYAAGMRYSNVLRIKTYIDRLANPPLQDSQIADHQFPLTPATVNQHKQTLLDDMSEYMLTNFRLVKDGVLIEDFRSRFDRGLMAVYSKQIEQLMSAGLIEIKKTSGPAKGSEVVRLTKRGRLLGNQVFIKFVA